MLLNEFLLTATMRSSAESQHKVSTPFSTSNAFQEGLKLHIHPVKALHLSTDFLICVYIYTYIHSSLLLTQFLLDIKTLSRNLLLTQKLLCKLGQKTNRGLSQAMRNKMLKSKVKNLS